MIFTHISQHIIKKRSSSKTSPFIRIWHGSLSHTITCRRTVYIENSFDDLFWFYFLYFKSASTFNQRDSNFSPEERGTESGSLMYCGWWSSHVNLISHTLMAWTDAWPGKQETGKKKKKDTLSGVSTNSICSTEVAIPPWTGECQQEWTAELGDFDKILSGITRGDVMSLPGGSLFQYLSDSVV